MKIENDKLKQYLEKIGLKKYDENVSVKDVLSENIKDKDLVEKLIFNIEYPELRQDDFYKGLTDNLVTK